MYTDAEIRGLLVNIDVPDLDRASAFYGNAFGLTMTRGFGVDTAEPSGWPVGHHLLQKPAGSPGAVDALRHYDRHWTPVHLDVVADALDAALKRAPDLPVLLITGYAGDAISGKGRLDPNMDVLLKPFLLDAAANRVKAMIEAVGGLMAACGCRLPDGAWRACGGIKPGTSRLLRLYQTVSPSSR